AAYIKCTLSRGRPATIVGGAHLAQPPRRSKDMSDFRISRRGMLGATAALLASTALPRIALAQEPRKGGRLIVAADSEPRNLNPAMVASNGVFFVSSKVVEPLAEASFDGPDGL